MPQGSLKASKPKVKAHEKKGVLRKGQRTFKAKSVNARKSAQLQKQHSAALTSSTEKQIAAKVGHLELLKGSRKSLEDADRAKANKKKK